MSPLESAVVAVCEQIFMQVGRKLSLSKSKKSYHNLCAGEWYVCWKVSHPANFKPQIIEDLINIKISKGGKVRGKGSNPHYGEYVLNGRDMPFALTMEYHPANDCETYPGICLIFKEQDHTCLKGFWLQQHGKHRFLCGEMTMKRPKA